jgi:hypothetical protein
MTTTTAQFRLRPPHVVHWIRRFEHFLTLTCQCSFVVVVHPSLVVFMFRGRLYRYSVYSFRGRRSHSQNCIIQLSCCPFLPFPSRSERYMSPQVLPYAAENSVAWPVDVHDISGNDGIAIAMLKESELMFESPIWECTRSGWCRGIKYLLRYVTIKNECANALPLRMIIRACAAGILRFFITEGR